MRYSKILMIVTAAMTLSPRFCFAQGVADYPTKPVRVVVPSAPGGSIDVTPRLVGGKLSENLKHQFVVENRSGGGGTIGIGFVAKSAPDGYTILAAAAVFTIAPALYPNVPYDSVKGFAPISLLTRAPSLLLVHPALPVKSVKELIALARSKPGALDMGVGFSGSFTHLMTAYFTSAANIKVTLIPYKGSGDVIVNAIAGQVHTFFGNVLPALPHVKSGRLRALAVSSAGRSLMLPELPTISESGVRGYDVTGWHGWLAPAGTPDAIVNKLSVELAKAVRSPDVAKILTEGGAEPVGSTPEQLQQLIAVEVTRWGKVVKDSGMRVE